MRGADKVLHKSVQTVQPKLESNTKFKFKILNFKKNLDSFFLFFLFYRTKYRYSTSIIVS